MPIKPVRRGNVSPIRRALKDTFPLLGVTMGDPTGVGPEVILKALQSLPPGCRVIVLGDLAVLQETATRLASSLCPYQWQTGDALPTDARQIPVLALSRLAPAERIPGRPTRAGGDASFRYVESGARFALDGTLDGLVTAPISKAMWQASSHAYPGHTELLAALTDTVEVRMMLDGSPPPFLGSRPEPVEGRGGRKPLRVILVTTHMPLAQVPGALSCERIEKTITVAATHLRRFYGLPQPRLAVAGLNPHAGEAGAFGDEEQRLIQPAVEQARSAGCNVVGPLPADTVFVRAARGEFDAVICQYHDQALIPLKLLSWEDGVNVTLGLPIIRTSPDHGTAFDIAGHNKASPNSMQAALRLAAEMTQRARTAR